MNHVGTRPALIARSALLAIVVIVLVVVLAACGSTEEERLRVSSADTPDMKVAAAVYAQALTRSGIPATTDGVPTGDDAQLLEQIAVGGLDLFPAFSGDLLATLTPHPSPALGDELLAEVSRALPQGAAIGDPTGVKRGGGDEDEPGQDMVPVYRSSALDRSGLKTLSRIAGELTTADLDALGKRVAAGEDPATVAADWLSASGV